MAGHVERADPVASVAVVAGSDAATHDLRQSQRRGEEG